jgi:hypothetical protein
VINNPPPFIFNQIISHNWWRIFLY